jgi:hypothetical protein
VGNPAEETYCHPNKVNSMTDPCFVNWLLLGDLPDGVPHPDNTKLRALLARARTVLARSTRFARVTGFVLRCHLKAACCELGRPALRWHLNF